MRERLVEIFRESWRCETLAWKSGSDWLRGLYQNCQMASQLSITPVITGLTLSYWRVKFMLTKYLVENKHSEMF